MLCYTLVNLVLLKLLTVCMMYLNGIILLLQGDIDISMRVKCAMQHLITTYEMTSKLHADALDFFALALACL